MDNKNQILDILQYSSKHYDDLLFELYFAWAEIRSHNQNDLQKILANTAIWHWWRKEYDKLELEFIAEIKAYIGQVNVEFLRAHHDKKIVHIAIYFPKPLIKQARKLNLTPQIN